LREKAGRCGMTRDWELGEYGCELLLDSPPKAREKALVSRSAGSSRKESAFMPIP
jgi:hypothetical protein